jgi:hypothetical protein
VGIGVVFAICLIVLIVLVRRNPVCAVFFVHASVCARASMAHAMHTLRTRIMYAHATCSMRRSELRKFSCRLCVLAADYRSIYDSQPVTSTVPARTIFMLQAARSRLR